MMILQIRMATRDDTLSITRTVRIAQTTLIQSAILTMIATTMTELTQDRGIRGIRTATVCLSEGHRAGLDDQDHNQKWSNGYNNKYKRDKYDDAHGSFTDAETKAPTSTFRRPTPKNYPPSNSIVFRGLKFSITESIVFLTFRLCYAYSYGMKYDSMDPLAVESPLKMHVSPSFEENLVGTIQGCWICQFHHDRGGCSLYEPLSYLVTSELIL